VPEKLIACPATELHFGGAGFGGGALFSDGGRVSALLERYGG
jgi:hypothetical protein